MPSMEKCQRLIDTHRYRITPKGEAYLTPEQVNIFHAVTDFVRSSRSPILKCRDIKRIYHRGLLLSDFCYNLVNIAPDFEVKFLYCLGRDTYKFVNFNWDTSDNVKITWSPKGAKQTFSVGYRGPE